MACGEPVEPGDGVYIEGEVWHREECPVMDILCRGPRDADPFTWGRALWIALLMALCVAGAVLA